MKIVIAGNYGAENIGDEMILAGLLEKCYTLDPQAEITVLSGNPDETSSRHKVHSVPKFPSGLRSWIKRVISFKNPTRKAVKECDFFILGGGGLFGSLTFKANIIWGVQGMMALFHKKPLIICGQSIGPLKNWASRFIVKTLFSKAITVAVRDRESKKRLKKLKISNKVNLVPDMAFRIENKKSLEKREKTMIVALRQKPDITNEFKQNIAKFLNWLIKVEKWKIKFINFQNGEAGDSELHKEIIAMIHDKEKTQHIEKVKDHKELFKHFQQAQCALGMRLHSIITAIKTETPFIAINYAHKVKDFLNYAKLNQYIIEPEALTSGQIYKCFEEVRKYEKSFIANMVEFNKVAFQKHLDLEKNHSAILKKV